MTDFSDHLNFYSSQIAVLDTCESLMESYSFLENYLNDIITAITFAKLKVLHSSIITPFDLIEALKHISQSLRTNNLPLPIHHSAIAQYLEIIELQAYQSDSRIVFVLNIPLVSPEKYTLYRLYSIPILDNRTSLHHFLSTTYKYIARNDDSLFYTAVENLEGCKSLQGKIKLCTNLFPYPIDSDAICEAQLLRPTNQLPRTCQISVVFAKDYNVQQLGHNLWLIAVTDPLPVTIKCGNREIVTKVIINNSVLKLQPECLAFIGSTKVYAQKLMEVYHNVTYNNHPVIIPYSCCNHITEELHLPDIEPLKLGKFNTEDLKIAQHKLNQYSDELDRRNNQPFINKHLGWITTATVTLIVTLIILYITCKCKKQRRLRIGIFTSNDNPPPPPQTLKALTAKWKTLIPKRRPSVGFGEPIEEEEIEFNYNKQTS
ncbi:hypothetical protein ABEB36_012885 [Hypothenemus hampei]|uniref:Envelope protein n=1 Tax=Hypothenemus hampei TaxID=57062 RepID=A0ABD1E6E3_HYPHA